MLFKVLHFRNSDKILKKKGMNEDIDYLLNYLENVLFESQNKGGLLKQALKDTGWRNIVTDLNILNDRRYQYKGYRNRIAIECNFNFYEFILEGLFRLQVGFDKKMIDSGILILNSLRSNNNPHGDILTIAEKDISNLYPTISLPVSIVLYDFKESLRELSVDR